MYGGQILAPSCADFCLIEFTSYIHMHLTGITFKYLAALECLSRHENGGKSCKILIDTISFVYPLEDFIKWYILIVSYVLHITLLFLNNWPIGVRLGSLFSILFLLIHHMLTNIIFLHLLCNRSVYLYLASSMYSDNLFLIVLWLIVAGDVELPWEPCVSGWGIQGESFVDLLQITYILCSSHL